MPGQIGKLPGQVIGDDLGDALKNWNESLKSMGGDLEPEKLSPDEKQEMKAQIEELKKQLDELHKRLSKDADKPAEKPAENAEK